MRKTTLEPQNRADQDLHIVQNISVCALGSKGNTENFRPVTQLLKQQDAQ